MESLIKIAIIGAAIRLQQSGFTQITIFEKVETLGGTWRDNTYPGCGCDVPSNLYSYSFEKNPNWSRQYSSQEEILEYLNGCADKYKITPLIKFNTHINSALFNEEDNSWNVTDHAENATIFEVLISASGGLNEPSYPKIKGIKDFKGVSFHSNLWNHDYDLKGEKVAVIWE